MRNLFITLTFVVFLFSSLIAQETYFWSNGKKVTLHEDKTSMIIYEKDTNQLTLLSRNGIDKIMERSSSRLGSYKIVKMKDMNTDVLSFNDINIKAKMNGFVSDNGETMYLTNYIILKFKAGYTINSIDKILLKYNATYRETMYNVVVLNVLDINNVNSAANEIFESGIVEWCRPNFIRNDIEHYSEPRDKQYYIHNKGRYCGAFNKDINAIQAWMITTGCSNIRVAVIDDGVEDHPDLNDANGNSRVLNGYSIPGEPANGRTNSLIGHGESVAGVIAASHSTNMRGIAPKVLIIPVNFGFQTENNDEMERYYALNWAWDPMLGNADILNNSWGPKESNVGNELYIEAINNAKIYGRGGDIVNDIPGLGAIVVFASGNFGLNDISDYAKVSIAVGAIDKYDTPAKDRYGNRYTHIGPDQDLVAYGGSEDSNGLTDIRSIDRVGFNGSDFGNYYDFFGGTSAATPMVSGAAALILSINPNLTRTQVENILFSTATDLGTSGRDNTYGYGKLNVYEACKAAIETRTNNFVLNNGYLSCSKILDDYQMAFVGSPGCNIASGVYLCNVYKLEATVPQNSIYIGDGLSLSNPNTGEYYSSATTNGTNLNIVTYFYYVKTNMLSQVINQWVPYDPSNIVCREYISFPPENIIYNGVVNSGITKSLKATNSIKLTSGFRAIAGSNFHAMITLTSEDIFCLPNPTDNITLKLDMVENSNEDEYIDSTNSMSQIANIDNIDNDEKIIIYPNPNKGNFFIDIQGVISNNAKVEIFSIDGSLKYSCAIISNNQNIIFTQIPGMYLIKIYNNGKKYTEKIILQ